MDAGRRYMSPGSEIKDFIAEIAVLRVSAFLMPVPQAPIPSGQ